MSKSVSDRGGTEIPVPGSAAPGGHYSHVTAGGGLVFVSGQLPIGPNETPDPARTFSEQAVLALDNLERCLAAAGCRLADLLKVSVYITDIADWPTFNTLYAERLGEVRPARVVVPVPELHYGFQIELDAVALIR